MSTPRANMAAQIRRAQTPAEELRAVLARLETMVANLEHAELERPAEILELLDRAQELLDTLAQHGGDPAAEQARFQTISQQLERKARTFVSRMGGPEALRSLREKVSPPAGNPWWTIDERLAADRHARQRRTIRTIGMVVAAFALLSLIYTLFLAPDEATRVRHRHEMQAEAALTGGDVEQALAEIEIALSYAPGDDGLLVMRGVIHELLGNARQAEQDFDAARRAADGPEAFHSARAQAYMTAGAPDRALEDAQHIIEINPDSAVGHFQMGNVNAALGNFFEAGENFEKASQLAAAAGQTELEGMARVQLANLLLLMSAPQFPTESPQP